ncbi:hypothetical protein HDU98_004858 [Podochytrium sp. JEL0797]|nr:hypothetical protein HDU98_004858 [Podochytrium sp. JEL0797]
MLKWFTSEQDYAEVLQGIEDDIKRTEENMVSYAELNAAWQAVILRYLGGLYAAYLVGYFTVLSPVDDTASVWLIKVAVLTLFPVCIYYSRILVDIWYKAKIRSNGRNLDLLRTNQKLKVEELKKKTGYYTTKNLLDKFDTPPKQLRPKAATPKAKIPHPQGTPHNTMQTPVKPGPMPNQQPHGSETPFSTPMNQLPNGGTPSITIQKSPAALTPSQSTWFDRVMDAVVGDTEGPQTKYALVCQSCFDHNGLCPPELYETIKFKCKSCGYLNAPFQEVQHHRELSRSRSNSVDNRMYSQQQHPQFSGDESSAQISPSLGRNGAFVSNEEGAMLTDTVLNEQVNGVDSNGPNGVMEGTLGGEVGSEEQLDHQPSGEVSGSRYDDIEDAEEAQDVEPFAIQGEGVGKENVSGGEDALRKRK